MEEKVRPRRGCGAGAGRRSGGKAEEEEKDRRTAEAAVIATAAAAAAAARDVPTAAGNQSREAGTSSNTNSVSV